MKRNPVKTKKQILKAATEHFSLDGIAGARVDEIAKVAKINKAMIYHYFGDKESLYEAALKQQMQEMTVFVQIESKETNELSILKQMIDVYFDYCLQNPHYVSLMMWEMVSNWKYLNRISSEISDDIQKMLVQVVKNGQLKGIFYSDIDPRIFVSLSIMQVFCSFSLFYHPHLLKEGAGTALDMDEMKDYRQKLRKQILRSITVDNEKLEELL